MAAFNLSGKIENRNAKAVAIELYGDNQHRMRDTMLLVATVLLATTIASHAFAAGRVGGGGFGAEVRTGQMSRDFSPPIIDEPLSTPAPTFNLSDPYTVPQSSETPVSPASPGSIFGNG